MFAATNTMCINFYQKRQCGKKHGFSLFVCAFNISGKSCTRCCSFTAVVAFGDENLFAVVSWRKSGIYFIGHLLQIKSFQYLFVTITGVVCFRKIIYSKVNRRASEIYFKCKIVLAFVCNGNRRCLLSKVILFKRKSARVGIYFI